MPHNEPQQTNTHSPDAGWSVYIIRTQCDKLYTGITTDIQKRWRAHETGKGGAKFFRGHQPAELLFLENGHSRSSASRREAAIKKLPREAKLTLIHSQAQPPVIDLSG